LALYPYSQKKEIKTRKHIITLNICWCANVGWKKSQEFQRIIEENIPIMDKHYIYQEKYNIILVPVIICGLHIAMERKLLLGIKSWFMKMNFVRWRHRSAITSFQFGGVILRSRQLQFCINNNKDWNFKFIVSISSLECNNFCTGYASSEADFLSNWYTKVY
jgi:hypothetical protein